MIHYLDYWERAINQAINYEKYSLDEFHNMRMSDVDEFYLLCPECGKILFDNIEVADKFLKGQPIKEDDICPDY
jgi:hypothetical protein